MAAIDTQPLIPKGYTFNNPKELISIKGKRMLLELMEQADKRDPDAFDMYIYNDFYGYAMLDLIDDTLSKLHAKVVGKKWNEAMAVFEALTPFLDMTTASWMGVDDGERCTLAGKVYGALLVTFIRRIAKEGKLNEENFPSLETVLRGASNFCQMCKDTLDLASWDTVCKGVAQRLFPYRDRKKDAAAYNARVELEKKRIDEWIAGLSPEEKKKAQVWLDKADKANKSDDGDDEEDEEDEEEEADDDDPDKPWYGSAKDGDEDDEDDDYVLTRVWREYKAYLSGAPNAPMRGPPKWDLTKWTEAQKKQFKFDAMDEEDVF